MYIQNLRESGKILKNQKKNEEEQCKPIDRSFHIIILINNNKVCFLKSEFSNNKGTIQINYFSKKTKEFMIA